MSTITGCIRCGYTFDQCLEQVDWDYYLSNFFYCLHQRWSTWWLFVGYLDVCVCLEILTGVEIWTVPRPIKDLNADVLQVFGNKLGTVEWWHRWTILHKKSLGKHHIVFRCSCWTFFVACAIYCNSSLNSGRQRIVLLSQKLKWLPAPSDLVDVSWLQLCTLGCTRH